MPDVQQAPRESTRREVLREACGGALSLAGLSFGLSVAAAGCSKKKKPTLEETIKAIIDPNTQREATIAYLGIKEQTIAGIDDPARREILDKLLIALGSALAVETAEADYRPFDDTGSKIFSSRKRSRTREVLSQVSKDCAGKLRKVYQVIYSQDMGKFEWITDKESDELGDAMTKARSLAERLEQFSVFTWKEGIVRHIHKKFIGKPTAEDFRSLKRDLDNAINIVLRRQRLAEKENGD